MPPRTRSVLLLLLAGFIVIRAQSPSLADLITGTVLDPDAEALGGAQVTLKGGEPPRSLSITTGGSGPFRFEKPRGDDYEILGAKEGFKPTTARVTISNRPPRCESSCPPPIGESKSLSPPPIPRPIPKPAEISM
jgi:hypothetical protein